MFSKPDRSAQNSFPAPPRIHVGAYLTGGLKELYHRISRGEAIDNTDADIHTNEKGHFRPGHDGPVVMAQRYYITEVLNTRGQSAILVYAEDLFQQNRVVVIKILHTSYFTIGAQEADCLRRLAVADPLHVSHTVKLLNTFLYGGHFCMVFESLCPQPITDIFGDLQLPNCTHLQKVKKLTLQLLVVLGFLRKQNTIHADLKPENILLKHETDLNSVQVIDFGNSIQHVHKEVSLYYRDFDVQTLLYRAPEVMFGIPFGTEIDMWSLGCILAELYLGRPLFFGKSKTEILTSITSVLGPLPKEIFQRGKFSLELEQFTATIEQEDATSKLMQCLDGSRDYAFANFLAQVFRYDPDERMSPSAAAEHPFLAQELCVSFLLPLAVKKQPASSILLNSATYKNSVKIASEVKRQNPSTYDLLVMGTESRYDSSFCETRVAEVQPYKSERDIFHESRRYSEGHLSRSSSPFVTSPQHQYGISMGIRRDTVPSSLSQSHCLESKHRNDSGFYEKLDCVKSEEKYSAFSCGRSGKHAFDLTRNLPSRPLASCRSHERSRSPLEKRKRQDQTHVPFNKQTVRVVYQEHKSDSGQRSRCRGNLYQKRSVQDEEGCSGDQRAQVFDKLHSRVKVLVKEGSPSIQDCRNVAGRTVQDNSGITGLHERTAGPSVSSDNTRTCQSASRMYHSETPTEERPATQEQISRSQPSTSIFSLGIYNQNRKELADRNENSSGDENVNYFRPCSAELRFSKNVVETRDCDIFETQRNEVRCRYEDYSTKQTVSPVSHVNINTVVHSGKTSPQNYFTRQISRFSLSPTKTGVDLYGLEALQTVSKGQHNLGNSNSGEEDFVRTQFKDFKKVQKDIHSPVTIPGVVIQKEQKSSPLPCSVSKYAANVGQMLSGMGRTPPSEWKMPLEVKPRETKPERGSREKPSILEQMDSDCVQNRTTLLVSDIEDLSGDEAKKILLETTVQCREIEESGRDRKTDIWFVSRDVTKGTSGNLYTNRGSSVPTTSNSQTLGVMKTKQFWGEIQAVNTEADSNNEMYNREQRKCDTQILDDTVEEGTSIQQTTMIKQQWNFEKSRMSEAQSGDLESNLCEELTAQQCDAGDVFPVTDGGYGNIRLYPRGFHKIMRRKSSDEYEDEVVEAVIGKEGSTERDEVGVSSSPECSQPFYSVKELCPSANEFSSVRSVEQTRSSSPLHNLSVHSRDCIVSAKKEVSTTEYTESPIYKVLSPCERPNTDQDSTSLWMKATDDSLRNVMFHPPSRSYKHGCEAEVNERETNEFNFQTVRNISATQEVIEEDMAIDDETTDQIQTEDFKTCVENKLPDSLISTLCEDKSNGSDTFIKFTTKSDCSQPEEETTSQKPPELVHSSSSSFDGHEEDDGVNCVHELPEKTKEGSFDSNSEELCSTDDEHDEQDTKKNYMVRSDPASSVVSLSSVHNTVEEPSGDHFEIHLQEYKDKPSPKTDLNVSHVSYTTSDASDAEHESQRSKPYIIRRPHAKRQLTFAKQVQKKHIPFKYRSVPALHVNSHNKQREEHKKHGLSKDLKTIKDPYQFVSSPLKKQSAGKAGGSSARKPKSTLSRLKKRSIVTAVGRRRSSLDLTDKAINHRLTLLAERACIQSSGREKRTRKGQRICNKSNTRKSAPPDPPSHSPSHSDSQDSGTSDVSARKRQKTCHSESSHHQPKRKDDVFLKSTPPKLSVTSPKPNSDLKLSDRKARKFVYIEKLKLSAEKITPRNQTSTPRSTKNSRQSLEPVDLDESIIFIAEKGNSKQTHSNVQGEGCAKTVGRAKLRTPKRKNIDADDEEIVLLIS